MFLFDGSSTGMMILRLLKSRVLPPVELAAKSGQSLPRVRSGLRELQNAGFVEETEGKYKLSERGVALLK
jgi:DNA-binding IclR family transcriptional regulator